MPEIVPRIDELDSVEEIPDSEGATPPIVPVLTGITVSEGATQNSVPTTNVSEGVTSSPLGPTDISSTPDSSLLMPQLLNLNDTTLRRSRRTGIKNTINMRVILVNVYILVLSYISCYPNNSTRALTWTIFFQSISFYDTYFVKLRRISKHFESVLLSH